MSNLEPKPVFFPPTDEEIKQEIEREANDLVLCIMNERYCLQAYYNRVKQTTLWKNPRPLTQGSWDRLLAFCAPRLPQCKSYFKDKSVRLRAIELLKEHLKIDCQEALEFKKQEESE